MRFMGLFLFLTLTSQIDATPWQMVFPSMGSLWVIHGISHSSEIPETLTDEVIHITSHIELTFSDWLPQSELRQLEGRDLTIWQRSSPLFLEGLRLGKKLFDMTQGVFDITVGRTVWLGKNAIGLPSLEFSPNDTKWRFKGVHPERLTFDGFIKGYTIGLLAQKLVHHSFTSFFINAGGGDFAQFEKGRIQFISQSGSSQEQSGGQLHIFSPDLSRKSHPRSQSFASIRCEAFLWQLGQWPELGGITDGFSTALVLSSLEIPPNCVRN